MQMLMHFYSEALALFTLNSAVNNVNYYVNSIDRVHYKLNHFSSFLFYSNDYFNYIIL